MKKVELPHDIEKREGNQMQQQMDKRLTPANEDYLEAIYALGGAEGAIRSVDLAARLKVSKPSVFGAIQNLKQAGFVEQPSYGGITLTDRGAKYAAGILERHQVLYHFLIDILRVDPAVAVEEACKMEHAISDDTLERLTAHLRQSFNF